MPVPTHLPGLVEPLDNTIDEEALTCCNCGKKSPDLVSYETM